MGEWFYGAETKKMWLCIRKRGITRDVFLIGKYAFKFPSFRQWSLFLRGLCCNITEREISKFSDEFCPVLWSIPGGWLVVMPRCETLAEGDMTDEWYDAFRDRKEVHGFVERKLCSFGKLDGKIVAVDYGSA